MRTLLLLAIIWIGGTCAVNSQDFLKNYDLSTWYDLKINTVTKNGDWILLEKNYDELQDSVVVISRSDKRKLTIPKKGKIGISEKGFLIYPDGEALVVQNLVNDDKERHRGIKAYELLDSSNVLVLKTESTISLINLKTNDSLQIPLTDYFLSPNGKEFLYVNKEGTIHKVYLPDLDNVEVVRFGQDSISNPVWSPDNKKIAFLINQKEPEEKRIGFYDFKTGERATFNPSQYTNFPKRFQIADQPLFWKLGFSGDGNRLFFGIVSDNKPQKREKVVEIWRGADKILYPNRDAGEGFPKLGSWLVSKNRFSIITTEEFPFVYHDQLGKYSFLFNTLVYNHNLKLEGDSDILVFNHESDKVIDTIPRIEYLTSRFRISPKSDYMFYFKDEQWFARSLKTSDELSISDYFSKPLFDKAYDRPGSYPPFGLAGMTNIGELLIYDEYDIWKFNLHTRKKTRLSNGRENGIKFRLVKGQERNKDISLPRVLNLFNLNMPLYLKASDENHHQGYYRWFDGNVNQIVFNSRRKSKARINPDGIIFKDESQNEQPSVYSFSAASQGLEKIYKPHKVSDKRWGGAELLSYMAHNGKDQKISLLYPFNYDRRKKYPMVVKIYEDGESKSINEFTRPSLFNSDGFNSTLLRMAGFFIMQPDLVFKVDDPLNSANTNLNKALDVVLSKKLVDSKKIGLFGYSFGGFQANLMAAKNKRFSTVISGGGISDPIRLYTSIQWTKKEPVYYFFENYQGRLSKPYYELKKNYLNNSPIMFADQISVPMLLFAGKSDFHVNWEQSVAMYLALKRQNKKVSLLLYPTQRHAFTNNMEKKDISLKVLDWFNYYLKGEKPKNWITGEDDEK